MLAFVLVDASPSLSPEGLREALTAWGIETSSVSKRGEITVAEMREGSLLVESVPGAIPNGEADAASKHSLSRFSSEAKWRAHSQHLAVSLEAKDTGLSTIQAFTRAVAGVVQLVNAVGVYWRSGNVAHDADFFVSAAEEDLPLMAWSGVRVARSGDHVTMVTTGLRQFDLPELMFRAAESQGSEALASLFDCGASLVERGTPLPEGLVQVPGPMEQMRVQYEQSPFVPSERVALINLLARDV